MTVLIKSDLKNKTTFIEIQNLTKKHKRAIRNAGFDIGQTSKKEVQRRINNVGRTGRTYNIGGRVHRASAPGEAPANLSGALKRSVDYTVRVYRQVEIGYKAQNGLFLEDGTRNMERRPNLVPVGSELAQTFINFFVRHFKAQ